MPIGFVVVLVLLQDEAKVRGLAKAEAVIKAAAMRAHVDVLASDEFQGRLCGSAGNDRAAEYLAAFYKKVGLTPAGDEDDGGVRGYYQFFSFKAGTPRRLFRTRNVVAQLSGSDEQVGKEVVVVGAHVDHVGTAKDPDPGRTPVEPGSADTIYNGADDNASGTSVLMIMAQALVEAGVRPKRTIVFVHFNAEEWGLKGSEAYLARPPYPVGSHVAQINFDMVGRNSARPVTLKGAGSSPVWEELARRGNDGIDLKYRIVRPATGNTDYLNFLKKQIPALGFFTELHSDYHGVGDHADKLDYERMEKIARLALRMTVQIADAAERPAWTAPPPK